jgi:TonB-linked SusC/RagA family outer membrane protein
MNRFVRGTLIAAVGLAWLPGIVGGQQTLGVVSGQVTDAATQRPVPNVQVVVIGAPLGARTDLAGAYRIPNVPSGTVVLRFARIGYAGTTRTISLGAGTAATVNAALTAAPSILSAVVTTASGTEQRQRENGAAVATVNADSLGKAAIQNFSEMLSGRTPGVSVSQSTGTTGAGARIRIRGANSVSLSNEPLLIIDGIRIDNNPESNSIGVGGQSPSRLNDINPEDIETFDVIKGPAAAALYGTAAANGVIQITTKRGTAGRTNWAGIGEMGTVNEDNAYPPNYGGWTTTPPYSIPGYPRSSSAHSPTCNLDYQAFGICSIDSLAAYNTIEESHPFRTGHRQKLGANVSGGAQSATYYLGTDVEQESGIYHTSALSKLSLRGNVFTHPAPAVDVQISTGFVQSNLQLPQNDNNYYGVISNGLAGWQAFNANTQGYNPIAPSVFEQIDTRQELNRFTGGVNGTWRIRSWLSANATLGLDNLDRFDSQTLQPNISPLGNDALGSRFSNRFVVQNITTNYALTARNDITSSISSTAQIGYQYQRAQSRGTLASGFTLTAGSGSLGGVNSDRAVDESFVDNKTAGGFVSEQLAFDDRLFVTATLRADKNSAFGKNFGLVKYPALSASYVVAEGGDRLSQFRIRSAYGTSGLRPGVLDAIAFSNPVAVRLDSANQAGITVGNLSNPDLKAEKTREIEVGFDAGFYRDRARLEFTYYNKRSQDALVLQPLPPSLGGPSSEFVNLGAVSNKGFEVSLSTTPIQMERVELGVTVTASHNANRLDVGPETPIVFGLTDAQRHVTGYPLGGYWGTTVDSVHLNADHTLRPDSVFYSTDESAYHFLGSSLPTRTGSLGVDLIVLKRLHFNTMFEYRGGNSLYNASEQFRCLPFVLTCRGLNDAKAPIAEQANAFADAESGGSFFGGYVEDAGFVKWRELSIGVGLPSRYLTHLNATDAVLTFGMRNLHTWTNYTGLDPEVNFDGQANFSTGDFLTQPQVRYYTLRLNLTF